MTKISFFIDGYNLYHSLKDFNPDFRWLNLRSLCEKFVKPDEQIQNIYYFTAYATWNQVKMAKHKLYIKALNTVNVETVFGNLKKIQRVCHECKKTYNTHEEKQTDVNIAMTLFEDAMKDKFDTAIIISGDSDLVPPIKKISSNFPDKKIGVITPFGRSAKELKENSSFKSKITQDHLRNSLFDKKINCGSVVITAPDGWLPK